MKTIAIVGAGISGLTAAYLLSRKHQVQVFEQAPVIGGHTATVDIELAGRRYAIDTGFIVFNDKTYPNFLALLAELGVGRQPTEMSFSVKNSLTGLEYNGHSLSTLFAQKRNWLNPKFWGLLSEILRFNRLCKALYQGPSLEESATLGSFLQQQGFSRFFAQNYILPMGAAIWSSSLTAMELFPLQFFIRFFHNHGLLNVTDRPQWYVIPQGSRSYLGPLTQPFADRIQCNADIRQIVRESDKVRLCFADGSEQSFDELVLACHSDQALAMLADASAEEQRILSALQYSPNQVVLHTDESLLPKRRKAWASWNYQLGADPDRPACVTYNMNILQGIESEHTFCVTLNQTEQIAPEKILRRFVYHHPVYSVQSLAAAQQRVQICGQRHTHFAGAYWYNGFHEDGVRSALDVAQRFDCDLAAAGPAGHG
ncbi:FAD-dependent oxidoreductase [Rheinheimera sp.]|uniref:NAD(P)/FAD-dependent oxidoreductase n=1 Tax=Rheinheimera sp. TaxID=1869214 RepID=UPI00307F2F9E